MNIQELTTLYEKADGMLLAFDEEGLPENEASGLTRELKDVLGRMIKSMQQPPDGPAEIVYVDIP